LKRGFDKPVLSSAEGLSPNGLKGVRDSMVFPFALSLSKGECFKLTHYGGAGSVLAWLSAVTLHFPASRLSQGSELKADRRKLIAGAVLK
jgi:hypothetical protein